MVRSSQRRKLYEQMDDGDQRTNPRPVHQDVQRAGRQLLEPRVS